VYDNDHAHGEGDSDLVCEIVFVDASPNNANPISAAELLEQLAQLVEDRTGTLTTDGEVSSELSRHSCWNCQHVKVPTSMLLTRIMRKESQRLTLQATKHKAQVKTTQMFLCPPGSLLAL
jgi:hypothetical protein